MGIDQTITLGPFIKCRYQTTPEMGTFRNCTADSSHKSKGQFCSKCGSPVSETIKPTGKQIRNLDWDVLDKLQDRVYQRTSMGGEIEPGIDIWVSNVNDGIPDRSIERYTDECLEIDPSVIRTEKDAFSVFFAKEIGILQSQYSRVQVCWGLLSSCS
jgi:hypothetical protein